MHRPTRILALAGGAALLATTFATATVSAASPTGGGHVYVNENTAGSNRIAGFDRHADGSLTPIPGSPFDAGGAGTGAPFGSAGGLQETADGRYILATDPGSDQISVLRIKPHGQLQLADVVASGGRTPTSIAVHDGLVYVANGGAGGSDYAGFRLNAGGHLRPIADAVYALPDIALPGHVLFSPDGARLVATRVGPNAGPSYLDAYRVTRDGHLVAATRIALRRAADRAVRECVLAQASRSAVRLECARRGERRSVSVYDVAGDGSLSAINGSPFADRQTAPCWVAISPDGQALFAVNTAVPSVSRYAVASDGALTLVGSTPFASPTGLRPFDASVSPDGRFLYVVDAGVAKVSAFAVDGTSLTELTGSPVSVGGGAPFGIVVD